MKTTLRRLLTLSVLAVSLSARAADVVGPERGWSPIFTPASPGMFAAINGAMSSEFGAALIGQVPALGALATLNQGSTFDRRLMGALAGYLPRDFEARFEATALVRVTDARGPAMEALVDAIAKAHRNAAAVVLADAQSHSRWFADEIAAGRASEQDIKETAAQFERAGLFGPGLSKLAAEARERRALGSARRIAESLQPEKAEFSGVVADPMLKTLASRAIEDLHESNDAVYGGKIIDKLIGYAEREPGNLELQKLIAEGLVEEFSNSSDGSWSMRVIGSLERLAQNAKSEAVFLIAVRGVMADVAESSDSAYAERAVSVVTRLAAESRSRRVRDEALKLILEETENADSGSDYSLFLHTAAEAASNEAAVEHVERAAPPAPRRPEIKLEQQSPASTSPKMKEPWSDNAWLGIKIGAVLIAFLAALKVAPQGHMEQLLGELSGVALMNWFMGPIRTKKLDTLIFIAVLAALVAVPLLAPPAMIATALGTIGGAYMLALFLI